MSPSGSLFGTETDETVAPGADAPGAEVSDRDAAQLGEGPRRRWPIMLGVVVVALAVVAFLAYRWVQGQLDPPGDPGEEVVFVIDEGLGKAEIADQLAAEGIIENSMVFEVYARIKGAGAWEAGQYTMRLNSSADDVIAILDGGGGEVPFDEVTVPEGFTVFAGAGTPAPGNLVQELATVERFDERDILALLISGELRSAYQPADQPSLEGLLFPDTYRIEEEEDERALVTRMIERFDQVARDLGYDD
ncbi:MAG: endolytic transglycosylase MltG, partial [Actinomycetota bacterium]